MPMAEMPHGTTEAPAVLATGEADSEENTEDEARLPKTKKVPVGMTAAEWKLHKLTHLPTRRAGAASRDGSATTSIDGA